MSTFLHTNTHLFSSIDLFLSISYFVIHLPIPIHQIDSFNIYWIIEYIHTQSNEHTYVHAYMCSVSCMPVFPIYSIIVCMTYWVSSMLLLFLSKYSILLLILQFSIVYSFLSLSHIVCRTFHGVRCLYSYIDYLNLYRHLLQFLFLLLHAVIIRLLS